MSFDDDWGRPVESSGEFARPEGLAGHLIVVFPLGYVPFIQTRFTVQGKKSDAICCDIVDLDDKDEYGQPGKVYRSSNLMQAQLIVGLRPFIGRKVLGTIGKGVGKSGMNPPWVITDMSGDPACMDRARAWAAAHPDFVKSPFTARDEEAPAAAAAQLPPDLRQYTNPPAQQARASYTPPQHQPPQQRRDDYGQPPHVPVAGSPQLSSEELSVLQRMRQQAAEKARQQQEQYGDEPPF